MLFHKPALGETTSISSGTWSGGPIVADIFVVGEIDTSNVAYSFLRGDEDNVLIYDGDYAYRSALVSFRGGGGNDALFIGAADFSLIGSIFADGGAGNDLIVTGSMQGAFHPGSGIDGGDGDDIIRVLATFNGVGIFANTAFAIRGGAGDDLIDLHGIQFNLRGEQASPIDGGDGFDTLVWNLSYDLGTGTDQTGADSLGSPFPREIIATNLEELVLDPAALGSVVRLSDADVFEISAGSEFDRSTLGLSLEGSGGTLFLAAGTVASQVDLTGWTALGSTDLARADGYVVHERNGALLVVDPRLMGAVDVPRAYRIDSASGGTIRAVELFGPLPADAFCEVVDANGDAVPGFSWDPASKSLVIDAGAPAGPQGVAVHLRNADHLYAIKSIELTFIDLSFARDPVVSAFNTVAYGDINGDGLTDLVGAFQQPDGSFTTFNLASVGLSVLQEPGRTHRDNRLADLDNDGDLDLLGTTYATSVPGPNIAHLFANDGTGTFTEVASFAEQEVQGFGETIVAADFNNDGLTDLYLPYYFRDDQLSSGPSPVAGSRLMINQGGLAFEDQTAAWTVINGGSLSLKGYGPNYDLIMPEGAQALDFNHDGLIDLYCASHLFLNLGGSFYDANRALGLPVVFEEGAAFFDWNNDGYFDLLRIIPHQGPQLHEFNPLTGRFELAKAFPDNLTYVQSFGLSVGDLDGDGWEDVFIAGGATATPRIFLNDHGRAFVEYRSTTTLSMPTSAGPVMDDIDGDGRADIVFGASRGILFNEGTTPLHSVYIELLGPNGERNQHGRVVQLIPTDPGDERVLSRIVDGGSGFMAQRNYTVQFATVENATYTAKAMLIDYASATPDTILFLAESDHSYTVRAGQGSIGPQVVDLTTGLTVARLFVFGEQAEQVLLEAAGKVAAAMNGGDDSLTLAAAAAGGWGGSIADGGAGDDRLVLAESNSGLAEQVRMLGGAGGDTISATTGAGGSTGNVFLDGGDGDDLIEAGTIRGGQGTGNGIDGGAGDDVIRVIDTGAGYGFFGDARFDISGGSGDDVVELEGIQQNSLGDDVSMVDGGEGFDTFVWNASYNLGRGGAQVAAGDPADPPREIGLRNFELLDIAESGVEGVTITLSAADVTAITAGSDLDRSQLEGLDLTGVGQVLYVRPGDNVFELQGEWAWIGDVSLNGAVYAARQQGEAVVLTLNRAPEAEGEQFNGSEDETLHLDAAALVGNDIDADGQPLAITRIVDASNGTALLNADGSVSFTPNPDFHGIASFSYEVGDGAGGVATAVAEVLLAAVEDPARVASLASPLAEHSAVGTFVAQLFDPEGDPFTLTMVNSANGRFALAAGNRLVTANSESIDFERSSSHEIVVRATAGSGATTDIRIIVAVADLPEALAGTSGPDFLLSPSNEAWTLDGLGGDDQIIGRAGADTLRGGDGSDVLDGRAGADTSEGGLGNDIHIVDHSGDLVKENTGEGVDIVKTSVSYSLQADSEVEVLTPRDHRGTEALTLTGNGFANTVYGNFGNNVLDGGSGAADVLIGLAGDDTYRVHHHGDVVVEAGGGGFDTILTDVSYTLAAGVAVELLSTASLAGTEALTLTGNAFSNTLRGNAGNNLLNGFGGRDVLIGLAGDDVYRIWSSDDVVVEASGQGFDIVFTSVSYRLANGVSVEMLSTESHAATVKIDLTGNELANQLIGNFGDNLLNGLGGADTMTGLAGHDRYAVDNAGDQVIEAAGEGSDSVSASVSYVLAAGQEIEVLSTQTHSATNAIDLTGNALAQTLLGNFGANVLDGKGGSDTLRGFAGADTFAFTTALGAGNVDTILDFIVADDIIALDDSVFTGLSTGALDAGAFVIGTAAQDAEDRIIYDAATGALYFDRDGSGGAFAAVQFATLSTGLAMTQADFVVI